MGRLDGVRVRVVIMSSGNEVRLRCLRNSVAAEYVRKKISYDELCWRLVLLER